MENSEKKEQKKTVTFRLFESDDEILNKIRTKYGISKSEVIETLIKKYAKEEYGAY